MGDYEAHERQRGFSGVTGPVLDLSTPPERLPGDRFWKLVGVDGRYMNTCRRFPGFKELGLSFDAAQTRVIESHSTTGDGTDVGANIYKIDTSSTFSASVEAGQFVHFTGVETEYLIVRVTSTELYLYDPLDSLAVSGVTSYDVMDPSPWDTLAATFMGDITTLHLFKYVALQDADTGEAYRGFVIVKTGAAQTDAGFLYYDEGAAKLRLLTIAEDLDNTKTYDVVSAHRNIVFVGQDWGAKTLRFVKPEANSGFFEVIDSGPGADIPSELTFPATTDRGTAKTGNAIILHVAAGYLGSPQRETSYRFRYRWYDPTRNLFTKISDEAEVTIPAGVYNATVVAKIAAAGLQARIAEGFTRLYCYRTIENGGTFYLEQIVRWDRDWDSAGSAATPPSVEDTMATLFKNDVFNAAFVSFGGKASSSKDPHDPTAQPAYWGLGMNDIALNLQRIYDPFYDSAGAFPQGGLLAPYQNMIISNGTVTGTDLDSGGSLRWSSIFTDNPENFPESDHFYRPGLLGNNVIGLLAAGDYAFAVRDDTVIRIHRNAGVVAINELYRKVGGTGRYAMNAVGNVAYVVTPQGLMAIDGTSGRQDVVGAVERLIVDPTYYWRGSLANVHMAYDAQIGAMCLLNTTTEEIYWLWTAGTGAVTSLVECPFAFVTEGPDLANAGNLRAYFATSDGTIFYVDADRSGDRQTMCGAGAGTDVNGKVSSASETTLINCSDHAGGSFTPPLYCVGFYLRFITGVNAGLSRKITAASTGQFTVAAFPNAPAVGDYFSVAPVLYDVGFPPIRVGQEPDLSTRKILHGMSAFTVDIAGETDTSTNPGFYLEYAAASGLGDSPTFYQILSNSDKTQQWKNLDTPGQTLMPEVRQASSDVDFELLGLGFEATIQASGALGPGEGD